MPLSLICVSKLKVMQKINYISSFKNTTKTSNKRAVKLKCIFCELAKRLALDIRNKFAFTTKNLQIANDVI